MSATSIRRASRKPTVRQTGAVLRLKVVRRDGARHSGPQADCVAVEEPLEIRVRGRSVAVTMRTPGHDQELAAGFLLTEGIIHGPQDIVGILHCRAAAVPANTLNVFLAPSLQVDFAQLTRHVFASSSCGLCGKASIESVHRQFPPVKSRVKVSPATLVQLPKRMRSAQSTFDETGGLHAAAIFTASGDLVVVREDVGRHNAVDKVLGFGLLQRKLPFDSHILLVSGRASFEILQKALAGGVACVCSVSAPSSLAVEFARKSGQTLIGFLRGQKMNVYAGSQALH